MLPADDDYVELTRSFRELTDDAPTPLARRMFEHVGRLELTWRDLLAGAGASSITPALVVVAPSNAGKSAEMRAQARRLQQTGAFAFYAEARAIAKVGIRRGLYPQDTDARGLAPQRTSGSGDSPRAISSTERAQG